MNILAKNVLMVLFGVYSFDIKGALLIHICLINES